ncbi:hypothetical protein LCGC14_2732110 [marine sediment metagenome]|uniref:Uncharacterized protein n=1 Tax=marine sediment metagenome TaxID=412755 RepID=A0A0F8Z718_9ZZZZ
MRAETGRIDFDGDWSGVFFRGYSCWELKRLMEDLINKYGDQMSEYELKKINALACLFAQSHKSTGEFYGQSMKEYEECLKKQYEPKM